MKYNRFIVFEGIDACGKGTQQKKLAEYLYNLDKKNTVVMTRNPYNCPEFEKDYTEIRSLLKTMKDPSEQAKTLADLFIGNRFTFNEKVLKNSIENGYFVLCDRYDLSTIAYQGKLQGLGFEEMIKRHEGLVMPEITYLIDITAEESLKRASKSKEHKEVFDNMKFENTNKLRNAYLELAQSNYFPDRKIVIINGMKTVEEVFEEVKKSLRLEV